MDKLVLIKDVVKKVFKIEHACLTDLQRKNAMVLEFEKIRGDDVFRNSFLKDESIPEFVKEKLNIIFRKIILDEYFNDDVYDLVKFFFFKRKVER